MTVAILGQLCTRVSDHTVLRAEEKKVSQRRPCERRGGVHAGAMLFPLPPLPRGSIDIVKICAFSVPWVFFFSPRCPPLAKLWIQWELSQNRAFWKILFKICSLPLMRCCLDAFQSNNQAKQDHCRMLVRMTGSTCGMQMEARAGWVCTWMLACNGESYRHACWRWFLLPTFLWNKIYCEHGGSRKSICFWPGANPIKKHSFAMLVSAWNVPFNFAQFFINCRHSCWFFSGSRFTYLAMFVCSKGCLSMNKDISLLLSNILDFLSSKCRSKSNISGLRINCLLGSWSKQFMEIPLTLSLEKWLLITSTFQGKGLISNWLIINHGKIHQQIARLSVLENQLIAGGTLLSEIILSVVWQL